MDEPKLETDQEQKPKLEDAPRSKPKLSKAQQRQLQKPQPTANAKIIRDLMVANKVRGNPKDFVIIAGDRLMDWAGSYDMHKGGKKLETNAVALIHKSKLANVIGAEAAKAFWRPGFGRVSRQQPIINKDEK